MKQKFKPNNHSLIKFIRTRRTMNFTLPSRYTGSIYVACPKKAQTPSFRADLRPTLAKRAQKTLDDCKMTKQDFVARSIEFSLDAIAAQEKK